MAGIGRDLLRSLAGTDVVPRLVAERPQPEWRLGPLTVVVGPAQARLRYAREPIASARADADAIIAAWHKALARLRARSLAPDDFLPRLMIAYDELVGQRGGKRDDRVPLVDVRAALDGHTRAQFAWDLQRLRRERRLGHDGRRVEIGIATGHATARRSRVVWLEDDAGSGAWYETFRFITQEVRQ